MNKKQTGSIGSSFSGNIWRSLYSQFSSFSSQWTFGSLSFAKNGGRLYLSSFSTQWPLSRSFAENSNLSLPQLYRNIKIFLVKLQLQQSLELALLRCGWCLNLPCGSKSINNTHLFCMARAAAKLTQVVVFPTPPFWLAIAIILATVLIPNFEK